MSTKQIKGTELAPEVQTESIGLEQNEVNNLNKFGRKFKKYYYNTELYLNIQRRLSITKQRTLH